MTIPDAAAGAASGPAPTRGVRGEPPWRCTSRRSADTEFRPRRVAHGGMVGHRPRADSRPSARDGSAASPPFSRCRLLRPRAAARRGRHLGGSGGAPAPVPKPPRPALRAAVPEAASLAVSSSGLVPIQEAAGRRRCRLLRPRAAVRRGRHLRRRSGCAGGGRGPTLHPGPVATRRVDAVAAG